MSWLRLWFLLEERVDRRAYLRTGVALMVFKYLVEVVFVYATTGTVWTPLQYFHPFFTERMRVFGRADWARWTMALWTVPFVWIGVSMSVRRAVDVGMSPWFAMLFFVPGLNYVLMFVLASQASDPDSRWSTTSQAEADWLADPSAPRRRPKPKSEPLEPGRLASPLKRMLAAIGVSALAGVAVVTLSVFVFEVYSAAVFMGAPFLLGAVGAFLFNRPEPQSVRSTLFVTALGIAAFGGMMMVLALEGAVCLAMALPLALVLALPGALLGRAIALYAPGSQVHACLAILVLPLVTGIESRTPDAIASEVVSFVVIDAPPERVWEHVIRFSELPPPSRLVFELGIAYPVRARIDGEGVGAVRHCEFSTGAFVEPITCWEPPRRLSFDVSAQPPPMTEWSPYTRVHAPHLDDFLHCRRGEFRLIDLGDGRTRLEGSTWYELEMRPGLYWKLYTDRLIGSIHARVLEHIRRESEL